MVDCNGGVAINTQPTAQVMDDVRRAREFYRYLQPDNLIQPHLRRRASTFDVNNEHVPSLSAALAPYCQLAVLRCNATKAMLNVMDRDVMYFLAESSRRSTNDGREEMFEFVEDPIFLSCSSVPLKGRICELTIRQNKEEDQTKLPSFVIPDLTKSQFSQMSIVTGPPYYRFYAGVPMATRDGVNIGSIAVMDVKPRPEGLTQVEEDFLAGTAQQIMLYLETNRQAIEGRRSRRMAEGLEAFIAGKRSLTENVVNGSSNKRQKPKPGYGFDPGSGSESEASTASLPTSRRSTRRDQKSGSSTSTSFNDALSDVSTEVVEAGDPINSDEESRSHFMTFGRAANLLRQCMGDLGEDGSVQFVSLRSKPKNESKKSRPGPGTRTSTAIPVSNGSMTTEKNDAMYNAEVIASSAEAHPFCTIENSDARLVQLDVMMLADLTKRYPSGHLWSLEESKYSSSDEDAQDMPQTKRFTSVSGQGKKSSRRRSEINAMRAAFPTARQVLFAPLWDATSGSFAHAVFVTTALETRSFSASSELSFLNSFCSTVIGECSRIDTMMADRQKSDFVGTISHEMRSPLHGVLASVEFLADTEMNGFQKNLVDTIDSCGRTLLDTINHVLDFSKVNSFQKQWQAGNKKGGANGRRNHHLGPNNSSKSITAGAPPLLQLFGVTDISAVLEEVVDGLVLGHTYNSGIDLMDVSREARGRVTKNSAQNLVPTTDPVEVLVDIEQADWAFMTQPGAVRRIIMNITGNAIKYTTKGTILVELRLQETREQDQDSEVMVLTVTDTGKGISSEFLRSKLFVPFAQENALAPGTGLGLSIVKSIVLMLGGDIDVRSTIGKGTTVEVSLPVKRPLPGQVSTQNTPQSDETGGSGNSTTDDSLTLLQNQAAGATVVFFQRQPTPEDLCNKLIQQYVHDWYHLEFVDPALVESAAIVIVKEEDLSYLIEKTIGTPGRRPAIIVLCSVASRHSASLVQSLERQVDSAVEFLAKPCGPYKLARSIRLVLEKKRSIRPRFPQVTNLGTIAEAVTPIPPSVSALTLVSPSGEELADMDLNDVGANNTSQLVQATETFAASQTSQNAQMAIQGPITAIKSPRSQADDSDAFPFPSQLDETSEPAHEHGQALQIKSKSDSISSPLVLKSPEATPTQAAPLPKVNNINPKILIVDDNKINLRLLQTFLASKRKYTRITRAEDGQQAVDAVVGEEDQFDIIFMDISMPIKNGFQATREIREYEEDQQVKTGAMIIALTGLASGKDQSEGFDSGCDLYMTKPVSFREVGKLLDNWEKHQNVNLTLEMANLTVAIDPTDTINVSTVGRPGLSGLA